MGQGYVGLPLAMAAAKSGHHVVGFEPDKERYEKLSSGISYIEDVHSIHLQQALRQGTYQPAQNDSALAGFDVAVITVPTPLDKGAPDLRYVQAAAAQLGLHLREGALVVLESTTYPGTTRDVVVPLLEAPTEMKAGEDFHVGFSPERIDPGNQAFTFTTTPKIVSGLTEECLTRVALFYGDLVDSVVVADTLEEAELAKVFENVYRQVNIGLVHELQRQAHLLGVDVYNTLRLAGTKPFGFSKFTPGPGVGGHCIPVDAVFLTHRLRQLGSTFQLVEKAQEINDTQPAWVVQRLQNALNDRSGRALRRSRILALGASYKAGTTDMRMSPAVQVIELLRQHGASVDVVDPAFDPKALGPHEYHRLDDVHDLHDYNAVVLLTPHTCFDLTTVAKEAAYVLDTRGLMPSGNNIERL